MVLSLISLSKHVTINGLFPSNQFKIVSINSLIPRFLFARDNQDN